MSKDLIQQGIFDYNMNTTAAGMREDKAMAEAVRYFEALIASAVQAANKQLLENIISEINYLEEHRHTPDQTLKNVNKVLMRELDNARASLESQTNREDSNNA